MKDIDIVKLEEYACVEGSEIGELCRVLIQLWNCRSYFLSPTFERSVEKEILDQLDNFKENTKIVNEEVTTTAKFKTLEWK